MLNLFEKNIKFFYTNLPQYYKLIIKIKKNHKIQNDNLINIYTNEKIYPNSITKDSIKIATNPLNNPLWEKDALTVIPINWNKKFKYTAKAINYLTNEAKKLPSYNENLKFNKKFLPTTIICGLLSGKFLDILVKNHTFHSLFVYEPNPEFFAISLYFVDYEYIYKKLKDRFFLWVNGEIDYFAIEKFFYERIITSSLINLSYTAYNHPLIEDAKEKFNQVRVSKYRGWGTFEDEYKGVTNHLKNLNKYKTFIKGKNLNIPVCIIANGKSLEDSIEFIKKNKDSMILISVGTAIKPLLKENIQSDFHIEQERIDLLKDILKEPLKNYNGYFLGASVVNYEVFKYAKNPLMYIREGFCLENEFRLIGSSPIVGNAGFAFGASISNEIYLCGMDLGFRLNQKQHAKNSFYDDKEDIQTKGIKTKGNFSDDIYTDSLLLSSKLKIETMIKALNLKVYNLSDGAYIKGSIPLKDKTLPPINKEEYIKKITSNFKQINIKVDSLNLEVVLDKIEKSFSKEIKDIKELTGIIDFLEDILKNSNIAEIKMLKGSLYHYLFNLYLLSHKLSFKDTQKLLKKIKLKKFFPSYIHSNNLSTSFTS